MYWDIVEVRAEKNHSLWLRFADGATGIVRLDPKEFTGVLEPLRDPRFFERVYAEHGAASWPGGIDLAPDALYREMQKAVASSAPAHFDRSGSVILLIIQLNDIHIKDSSNPALHRIDGIVAAVRSLNADLASCILTVPGDIAYSGSADEYKLADAFFRETMSRLEQEFPGLTPQIVFSPGNHDCDLTQGTDVRQRAILDPLLPNLEMTGAVTSHWLAVQDPYFAFTAAFGQNHRTNQEKIALRKDFTVAKTFSIGVTTYNTAWLSENPETPGKLNLPVSWLREVLETPRDIEVSLFHQPYNWLDPNNAHQFKEFVESRSDLVLTGHEHRADSYTKSRPNTGPVNYIEGQAMYDPRVPDNRSIAVPARNSRAST
jgi:hypothetical protein